MCYQNFACDHLNLSKSECESAEKIPHLIFWSLQTAQASLHTLTHVCCWSSRRIICRQRSDLEQRSHIECPCTDVRSETFEDGSYIMVGSLRVKHRPCGTRTILPVWDSELHFHTFSIISLCHMTLSIFWFWNTCFLSRNFHVCLPHFQSKDAATNKIWCKYKFLFLDTQVGMGGGWVCRRILYHHPKFNNTEVP